MLFEDPELLTALTTRAFGSILKVNALEVPPPGAELFTVTVAIPLLDTSVAAICAVTCVGLIKLVFRFSPFHWTTVPLTKLLPLTVSVNPLLPSKIRLGERLLTVGTGLLTMRLANVEVPPPGAGLKTSTRQVPATARSAWVIWASNWSELISVVGRLLPFKRTMDVLL